MSQTESVPRDQQGKQEGNGATHAKRFNWDREETIAVLTKNVTTQLRVTLVRSESQDAIHDYIGLREWYLPRDQRDLPTLVQQWRPTFKGIAFPSEQASEVLKALAAAVERNIEWHDE